MVKSRMQPILEMANIDAAMPEFDEAYLPDSESRRAYLNAQLPKLRNDWYNMYIQSGDRRVFIANGIKVEQDDIDVKSLEQDVKRYAAAIRVILDELDDLPAKEASL